MVIKLFKLISVSYRVLRQASPLDLVKHKTKLNEQFHLSNFTYSI